MMNLFPRNGRGVGPGGRRRYRRKSCISIEMTGSKITPATKEYGWRARNCGMEKNEACSSNTEIAILRIASKIDALERYIRPRTFVEVVRPADVPMSPILLKFRLYPSGCWPHDATWRGACGELDGIALQVIRPVMNSIQVPR
jgi:hypothetical protein